MGTGMVDGVMARPIRIFVVVILLLVFLAVVVLLLARWLVDTEWVGDQMEGRIVEALDMEFEMGGAPVVGLLRGASISLSEPELRREGQLLARAETLRVTVDAAGLLTGDLRPTEVHVERPELVVERLDHGEFSVHLPRAERESLDELALRRLRLIDARLSYRDRVSDLEWLLEDCELDLRDLRHDGGEPAEALATFAADGDLHCERVGEERFTVAALSAGVRADAGRLELEPMEATLLEGELTGSLTVNPASTPPEYRLAADVSQFDLAAFTTLLAPDSATSGKLDLEVALDARGDTWDGIRSSAAGSISLGSGQLQLEGYDLDDELDDYSDTQRFNLVDVGAVFLAGPVGLVASRGYAFSGMLEGSEGSTTVEQMVSQWQVENGVAQAVDVAFRTPENRLALSGALDFNEYRFDDLKVAVVDSDGCPIVEQAINGPFHDPEVDQPHFLVTVAGPLLDLLERGVEVITDEDCETFYSGSISHP